MPQTKETITVIDTFGFLFRSYFALPPLRSQSGFPTGLLTGFMNFISNIGKDFHTDYLVFALDSKGDTFRNEIYKEYKSHRPEVPQDLLRQLPVAIQWIEDMGFHTASKVGYEADDIIASIAHDCQKHDIRVRIVSHDKDLYQLIDDHRVFLFDPLKKQEITPEVCFEKYGVYPHNFVDYQSLLGDSADNVPGVKGVGKKTAQALVSQYGDLDAIYANIENIEKKRWQTLLQQNQDMAYISKELVTLHKDAHVIEDLQTLRLPVDNPILKISETLYEYDMRSVVQRVHNQGLGYKTEIPQSKGSLDFEKILLDTPKKLFDVLKTIEKNSIVSLDTETTSVQSKEAKIVGFSFCFDLQRAYYVPIGHFYLGVPEQICHEDAYKALKILAQHKLLFQNFKYDYEVIKNNFNVELEVFADTMIMAWLLQSGSLVGLDALAKKYLNHIMIGFKDVVKKGEDFSGVALAQACEYASEDAYITYKLYFKLLQEIETQNLGHLLNIAKKYEFPFIKVLSTMYENGITVDSDFLQDLETKSKKYLLNLTHSIYSLCGCEFNINSPKQLGEVLFDTLKLPIIKKTKSGYSTDEKVLNQLVQEHEVVPKILEYREAYKLESTYIKPLLKLAQADKEHKVYTSFLQTGTATGRLSSKNPNLQNIPVRSESGRKIRQAFVAPKNKVLLGIDYSQIELRLLAHFSQDSALVEAFENDLDIHLQTAKKIFGDEAAQEKRAIAKSINFGLLYGMGSRKLAQTIGVTPKEAKAYIENYFESFPTVKQYLNCIEEDAQKDGYVTTLLGRIRKFDFENANGMQKPMYLREAVNTKFQGSAADLIKIAMLEIHKKIQNMDDIQMLLQIHDELIFEVDEEKANQRAKQIQETMENIYKLHVPLGVSVSIGKNWGELK